MVAQIGRLEDVVLMTNSCFAGLPHDRVPSPNFVHLPFDMGRDVYLEKLPNDLADRVMNACEPAGENFEPVRQFSQLYTFVRRNLPTEYSHHWDADTRLQSCVALSRLVKPTSVGFEYSAQLVLDSTDEIVSIVPGAVVGFGARAWIASDGQEDWFVQQDIEALKRLWSQPVFPLPPGRIARAFWYHEYAARTEFMAVRWTLVCTGIESLVNTGPGRATKQFVTRMPELAERFCGLEVSHSKAGRMYELRSKVAHGVVLGALDPATRALDFDLETTLRTTLLNALIDPRVGELFVSEGRIDQEWPLP